ncbi:Survival protein SurA precursor (Peptidyl-prolyl cis-trans isomerase SurA) [uncultured Candidatus Thioglobus sp.]|nr:Survival protein SurA precursor (Peptidyl-prolyl cis-trans isomerase SurA) [uncultured Candidatus Thioglobus sp.]
MKYLLTLLFVFSFGVSASPNSIIAIVNDSIITLDAISDRIDDSTTEEQKKQLLEYQIDIVLQKEEIAKRGGKPRPEIVNKMLENIAIQNKITMAQLRANDEFEKIVDSVTTKLSIQGLHQLILKDAVINVTKSEIEAAMKGELSHLGEVFEQIKIAQIVRTSLQPDSLASHDKLIQEFLIELSDKIKQGASFSNLVKMYSQDPSYQNNGESIWLDKRKLAKIFQQKNANLKLGEVSKPFKIEKTWRIIKIINVRKVSTRAKLVREQLIQAKQNAYLRNWIKKLRKNAYIDILEDKF